MPHLSVKVKVNMHNTYIAPQAATAAAAALLCHEQSGRKAYRPQAKPAATGLWPMTKQPYAALVCRLMVFTHIIYVFAWIITHLPTPKWLKAELA